MVDNEICLSYYNKCGQRDDRHEIIAHLKNKLIKRLTIKIHELR